MEQVELKKFIIEHLDLFAWREYDRKTYNINSEFTQALLRAETVGEAWTAILDGRILVIGGIIPHSAKTGYCFTMFSKYADQHKIIAAKTVKRMFDGMVQDIGYHRVVTYNRAGSDHHHKWCEWLGFKLETPEPIRKFDDEGNDYFQYALVVE